MFKPFFKSKWMFLEGDKKKGNLKNKNLKKNKKIKLFGWDLNVVFEGFFYHFATFVCKCDFLFLSFFFL
jgi:hypothetical protein